MPCPVSGKPMVGESCLRSGCPWADPGDCFVDCRLTGAGERPGTCNERVRTLAV